MADQAPVIFLSSSSSVKGKITYIQDNDKPVYTYLGIPFAEPPVGELRLKKPVTKKLWEGQRDASDYGPAPIQDLAMLNQMIEQNGGFKPVEKMDEDCLTLDIYTPTKSSAESLPVMVWIYGGAFIIGCTRHYIGTGFASLHDVILVTVNYRLGVLGFFSTGDETCPGNFAFWDMIEGLKWVQKHISKFGGDPSNVTIFGESAGGVSCHILNITPEARGLFHNMIPISGVSGMFPPFWNADKCKENCSTLAKTIGMPEESSPAEVHAAIMAMSPEDLVQKIPPMAVYFRPTLDGQLFKRDYQDMLMDGDFSKINSIYMINTDEGHMFYKMMYIPMELPLKSRADLAAYMNAAATMMQQSLAVKDVDGLAKALEEEYCPLDEPSEDEMLASVIEVIGDSIFYAGINKCAKVHADGVPNGTYYGVYGYRHSLAKHMAAVKADHADDIVTEFGFPFLTQEDRGNLEFTEADKKMSKILMGYFCNFAKTGNPNGDHLPTWPNFTSKKPQYLFMDGDAKPVDGEYKPARNKFWDTVREKYIENMF